MSTVIPFKRPDKAPTPGPRRRTVAEFAAAMAMMGLIFFLLPTLWAGVPPMLLAVVNLLVAVVYVSQGPRYLAIGWIVLSFGLLALTGAPSPASYALSRAAAETGLM